MKKFIITVFVGMCGLSCGMQNSSISYHSIVGDGKYRDVWECPVCRNSDELQNRIAANTLRFVSAAPSEKGKVAKELILEYENIFCTDEDNSHILRDLERDIDQQPKDKLSSEFLTETADSIAYLCDGLPDAAVKIQNMYETSGNYKLSLLWAIVAYRFGFLRAEDAIGRLIVAMRY